MLALALTLIFGMVIGMFVGNWSAKQPQELSQPNRFGASPIGYFGFQGYCGAVVSEGAFSTKTPIKAMNDSEIYQKFFAPILANLRDTCR